MACGTCVHFPYCSGDAVQYVRLDTQKDPYCEAYRATFDEISRDMALEMGCLMTKSISAEQAPLCRWRETSRTPTIWRSTNKHAAGFPVGTLCSGAGTALERYWKNRVYELTSCICTSRSIVRCAAAIATRGAAKQHERDVRQCGAQYYRRGTKVALCRGGGDGRRAACASRDRRNAWRESGKSR